MGLNKVSKNSNMYPFITDTWNLIRGKCFHDCTYCYIKDMSDRLPHLLDPVYLAEKELKTSLGKKNYIFVGSSTDMFAPDVPDEWIRKTVTHCRQYQGNKYLFQSKNPSRFGLLFEYDNARSGYLGMRKPFDFMIATTLESNRDYDMMSNAPSIKDRYVGLMRYGQLAPTMITVEPVLDFDVEDFTRIIQYVNPDYLSIGADSGNNNLPEPSAAKIRELLEGVPEGTEIVKKKNLGRILKEEI